MLGLVAEDGAVDAVLTTVVLEPAPDEACIAGCGSQDDLLAGADEQLALSAVCVSIGGVVALIQF
ncbi:hypothetical protein D3C72_2485780 [compost metagenome]